MKRIILLVSYFSFFINFSFSQAPEIEWQNTIGGNDFDILLDADETFDGGFILAGQSLSGVSGDKSQTFFGLTPKYDFWIVKINNIGVIEWEKTIGGFGDETAPSIEQTTDGGFILCGLSNSGITGDKTEISLAYDIWIIKLDNLGNIIWQNTIGGNGIDEPATIEETPDGGFILLGYSNSGISGDKTEICQGSYDFWIIKLNSLGDISWQNTIGGNLEERSYGKGLVQTSDGGYLIGGWSVSGVSGDKTQPSFGGADYWIVKLNSVGIIEWQKTIGGIEQDLLNMVIQTPENDYVIAGYSNSGMSGLKTENTIGSADYWVLKLNPIGEIIWQNDIGGSGDEYLNSVSMTFDNGYILGGWSNSGISIDKSEANADLFGDYWVVKLNFDGNIQWENTIAGLNTDVLTYLISVSTGGYLAVGNSASNISVDKTENCIGERDYWIIKIFPDCTPSPELCNSLDDNCNGLIDDAITETISISAGGPITFCQGGNVLLTATYSGATVQWKKNGTNIPGATSPTYLVNIKGTYTCVTTSPCGTALSAPILVNVIKNPPASITAGGATTFCAGGSVILTANAGGGLSYQWYKGASLIAGATSINYSATIAGNYKCRVTKTATGCFKNSNVISVSVPCKEGEGINYNNLKFTIYPNPASEILSVFINTVINDNSSLIITDITGKTISSFEITSSILELNIYNYAKGIYFINLNINGEILTEKFIKD